MHKALFDFRSLKKIMLRVGFSDVREEPARPKEILVVAIK
jgi:hypothetical protein